MAVCPVDLNAGGSILQIHKFIQVLRGEIPINLIRNPLGLTCGRRIRSKLAIELLLLLLFSGHVASEVLFR